jgi:hypothetical protein
LAEDHLTEMTLPRLIANGATQRERSRIYIKEGRRNWIFPRDLHDFGAYISEKRITLAVLDPVDRIIPTVSSISGAAVLDELDYIAQLTNCAILTVGHTNKGHHTDIRAAMGGARRLLGVARSLYIWGEEPRWEHGLDRRRGVEFVEEREPEQCSVLTWYKGGRPTKPVLFEQIELQKPGDKTDTVIRLEPVDLAPDYYLPYAPLDVVNYQGDDVGVATGGSALNKAETARRLILSALGRLGDTERGLGAQDLKEHVMIAGVSQKTFENERHKLADEGLIEQFQDKDENGQTTSHRWRLKLDTQIPDGL